MKDRVASAVVHNYHGNSSPTDGCTIFTSEMRALTRIHRVKGRKFIIFSDSMSSLEALNGFKLESDLVHNIIKDYTHLTSNGKTTVFCWIPSHVNIRGNERADAAAKSVLSLPITNMKLPGHEVIASTGF